MVMTPLQFLDPLFDAAQAEAVAAPRRIEPDAIVGHRDVQAIVVRR